MLCASLLDRCKALGPFHHTVRHKGAVSCHKGLNSQVKELRYHASMKWLVALALIIATATIVVPTLLRDSESTQSTDPLDQIHESAAC